MFYAILTSILSGASLAVITFFVRKVNKLIHQVEKDFNELKESQRNQIKDQIVTTFEYSEYRGYISHRKLDTTNRLADSYFSLGGNSYIKGLMRRLNSEMPVKGESIEHD